MEIRRADSRWVHRGNWRKESTSAPSLLTKSCHDIDFLLWLLCSPPPHKDTAPAHLPSYVSSTGSVKFFRNSQKPESAGAATNCLSCPIRTECLYSAEKIYWDGQLARGNTGWPVKIVDPEIEDISCSKGIHKARNRLMERLSEDYDAATPASTVESRPWFGRCVWESDNDVCDDQTVTLTWEDDPLPHGSAPSTKLHGRRAKTAVFHMIAFTERICERRGRIYGTKGEIEYDSTSIRVHDFASGRTVTHRAPPRGGGHGGGDEGLATQFVLAVDAVKNGGASPDEAQRRFLGCSVEEVLRSHAMVFAAEEARRERKVVDWATWWKREVEGRAKREGVGS